MSAEQPIGVVLRQPTGRTLTTGEEGIRVLERLLEMARRTGEAMGMTLGEDAAEMRRLLRNPKPAGGGFENEPTKPVGGDDLPWSDQPPPGAAFMTADEAARVLGVSPQRVRRMCRDGDLPARQRGRIWLISEADVFDLAALRKVEHAGQETEPGRRPG